MVQKNEDKGRHDFLIAILVFLVLVAGILSYSIFIPQRIEYAPQKIKGSEDITGYATAATNVTVTNSAPVVSSVTLNNDAAITFTDIAPSTLRIYCNATVTDNNGCNQISTVQGYMIKNQSTVESADNASVHLTNTSCQVWSDGTGANTCTPGTDTSAGYQCAFSVPQYTLATDATSNYANDQWYCTVVAADPTGNGTKVNSSMIDVNSASLFSYNSTIGFGSVALGATSNRTTWYKNKGNLQQDFQIDAYGTADSDGLSFNCTTNNITVSKLKYGPIGNTGMTDLNDSDSSLNFSDTAAELDADVVPFEENTNPTLPTDFPNKTLPVGILVPSTGVGGSCGGIVQITAVADTAKD